MRIGEGCQGRRFRRSVLLIAVLGLGVVATTLIPSRVSAESWRSASSHPATAAERPLGATSIDAELLVGGLVHAVVIAHPGDGSGRLFFTEQQGIIRVFEEGQLRPVPFLDISSLLPCCSGYGLLGMAFDPDYEANGLFYVSYDDVDGNAVIARYSVAPTNPNRALPDSAVVLKAFSQPGQSYPKTHLVFGPDGYLYVGSGDGGPSDPSEQGQNLSSPLGKMLRLDVDAPPDYIPNDNPFVGDPEALDEIWSYGLRNPWRFSFDRQTGDLLIGDVGKSLLEEVDLQPASSAGGENWGWEVLEGSSCHSDSPPGACDELLGGGSILPVLEYPHDGGNCSVTGGYRYRGTAFPELDGVYFYADYCSGRIWGATEESPGVWSTVEMLDTPYSIVTFGEDESGELYFSHYGEAGEIYRVVGTGGGGEVSCEDVLRLQTRCVGGARNRIQARVVLTDASHDGETVAVAIDGDPETLTIAGSRAQIQQGGAASGLHTVSLDDPADCIAEIEITCP